MDFKVFLDHFKPTELIKAPESIPDHWTVLGKIDGKSFVASMEKDRVVQINIVQKVKDKK